MMPVDERWWKRVPAAEKLVEGTCDQLLNGKSIQVFTDMLWKEAFLRLVLDKVRNHDAGISIFEFDGESMDVGMSLIDCIAEQIGFGFNFDGKLQSLVGKLQNNDGYIFQLRGLSPQHLKEAHLLVKDINKQNYHIALILEDDTQVQVKAVHQKKFSATQMDIHYFAWTLLLDQGNVPLLEYAAILCEELSGGDPKRCVRLCDQIHDLMKGIYTVCDWFNEKEILWHVYIAQLRGIQPIIEELRLGFIDSLGGRVNKILPFVDEYHNEFTKAHEVELRHMIYYKAMLTISPTEQKTLDQLYNARNDLAHLRVLSEDQISWVNSLVSY